ncbi:MAG: proline iminopeptidase-family hydrolase [Eubacteriaceae bacterium]|jgi:proline iminopeptidase/L-proline amide hydrolase|nr:proline iminopeptidase-family hydrolase [Eubacteriaceae bacterium]
MSNIKEGYIPFKGLKTYYRIVGECEDGKLPLLTLHGGPGAQHDYLESFDGIADYGRAVIYYDQLGCGKSPAPSNPDMWTVELFKEEIDVVRNALNLTQCHMIGQSWGGMLLMAYAIDQPVGVKSMVVASSPADFQLWGKEAKRLRGYLPQHMQDALIKADETGVHEGPEYQAAADEYYRRYVYDLPEVPDYVQVTFDTEGDNEVYNTMQGYSEFDISGNLKDFNVVNDLHKITIPTLVTSGSRDECTPLIAKQVYDGIPNAQWILFEDGTHLVHVEQKEKYNKTVEEFFEQHDII